MEPRTIFYSDIPRTITIAASGTYHTLDKVIKIVWLDRFISILHEGDLAGAVYPVDHIKSIVPKLDMENLGSLT